MGGSLENRLWLVFCSLLFAWPCVGKMHGATTYHLYLSATTGTAVSCASLPAKASWGANTYLVNTAQKFDCLINHALGQGALVSGKPVDELQIHLTAGTYTTLGVKYGFNTAHTWDVLKFLGSGSPKPTVQLVNQIAYPDYLQMFEFGWIRHFEMKDIALDCAWHSGIPSLYGVYYKTGGLMVRTFGGAVVENVTVTGFGSKGVGSGSISGSGTEAFGILISTADFGQSGASDYVLIRNCEVKNFSPLDGGYCTGINVGTWFDARETAAPADQVADDCTVPPPNAQQRPQTCSRPAWVAVITNNYVHHLTNGIALGAANAEYVRVRDNKVSDCKLGFNCDTALAPRTTNGLGVPVLIGFLSRNVEIVQNYFTNCLQGVNIGTVSDSSTRFTNFTISTNYFINLQGWYKNSREPLVIDASKYPLYEECWGIQLNGATAGCTIQGNRFGAAPNFVCVGSLTACTPGYNNPQNFLWGPLSPVNYWFPIRVLHGVDNYQIYHYQTGTHTYSGNKLSDGVTSVDSPNYLGTGNCNGGTHTADVCD